MSLSALVTAVLLGQSALAGMPSPGTSATERVDVAYREIASGQSQAAMRKLEAEAASRSNDPAVLINLGATYAQAGMTDKAITVYRAAVASPDRYDLELADGSWADSRDAARQALKGLMASRTMAAR